MPFNSPSNIRQLIELLEEVDKSDSDYGITSWEVMSDFDFPGSLIPYRINVRLSFGFNGVKSRTQRARSRSVKSLKSLTLVRLS